MFSINFIVFFYKIHHINCELYYGYFELNCRES